MINQYKINYQNGGSSKESNISIILLDGTSSSGKTSICNYFSAKGYKCLIGDDYFGGKHVKPIESEYENYIKDLSNEYFGKKTDTFRKLVASTMIDKAIESGNGIIDAVILEPFIDVINERNLNDSFKIILLYTNLKDLVRNMESRRKQGDSRGIFVFKQFVKRYEKSSSEGIDTVNRSKFKKLLLDNLKYEFVGEEELIKFCNEIFEKLGITDDNDHYIKVRDDYKYDFLLSTVGKSKADINEELGSFIQ